jgi:ADP-heptose:LPS heptosyltransferase
VKKILVIRFSSIGDIVLASPVIRCLREQVPGCELHFLTKKQYHPLVSGNPNLDKIYLYERNFHELIPLLQAEKYDFITDLHRNYRSWYIRSRLLRRSGSFPKLNIRKWIFVRLKLNLLPPVHLVDRYFHAVHKLGVRYDGKGLDYYIPPDEEIRAGELFPGTEKGFIAFAIGARHSTKLLPPEKVTGVCEKAGKPVILLGGKEDVERGREILGQTGGNVHNGCGILSLSQSASVIRQADALITNDTGMMHIGAAFRKKIVSVWGNTVPAFGMYPLYPEGMGHLGRIVEVKGLRCRPCSKLGYSRCPKGHFNCMNRINTGEITEAL